MTDVGPLVEFFREEGFYPFGHRGDYEGWSPEQTAVHFLREHLACREALTDQMLDAGAQEIWGTDQDSVVRPYARLSPLLKDDLRDTADSAYRAMRAASCDTRPKGEDAQQASFTSGAVPSEDSADAQPEAGQ